MRKFENPMIDIEIFEVADVIATSIDCGGHNCPNQTDCELD